MHRFLVTGGAGFIGSNIVDHLLNEGHFVRVLDNLYSGNLDNLTGAKDLDPDRYEFIEGDIRDQSVCGQACDGIDFVLHQAALRSVPKSLELPHDFNDVNIGGTLNMLQASQKSGVKRFVLASSSSIYGDTDQFPEREESAPLLISPYALTKLTGEYYCRIFTEQFNLETVCLRYFNVFGPRQALDDEYAVVVPKFIHSIMNNQSPPIFGDGHQSRDFTFVDNVISANLLAATTPGLKHEVLNVANGQHNSVLNLLSTLNKILGTHIDPEFRDVRAGDVYKTHADITKIQKVLNYKPLVSFEEGLEKAVEYFKGKFDNQ